MPSLIGTSKAQTPRVSRIIYISKGPQISSALPAGASVQAVSQMTMPQIWKAAGAVLQTFNSNEGSRHRVVFSPASGSQCTIREILSSSRCASGAMRQIFKFHTANPLPFRLTDRSKRTVKCLTRCFFAIPQLPSNPSSLSRPVPSPAGSLCSSRSHVERFGFP
jgi:hypothetical protein